MSDASTRQFSFIGVDYRITQGEFPGTFLVEVAGNVAVRVTFDEFGAAAQVEGRVYARKRGELMRATYGEDGLPVYRELETAEDWADFDVIQAVRVYLGKLASEAARRAELRRLRERPTVPSYRDSAGRLGW